VLSDKWIERPATGYAHGTDVGVAECVDACAACGDACDRAAGRLVGQGGRAAVDALIAGSATTRLVADLLREGAELDDGVVDLCVVACERCADLGIADVVESCAEVVRCLRALP
jgi:hypothetical protein